MRYAVRLMIFLSVVVGVGTGLFAGGLSALVL
jgi:hypothetical protein